MNEYKELIADLTAVANRNSNSLNTRDACRKAADVIEQLVGYAAKCEKECEDAEKYIEQLVRERDAAIADISMLIIHPREVCKLCKHDFADTAAESCPTCGDMTPYGNFEWRGVKK